MPIHTHVYWYVGAVTFPPSGKILHEARQIVIFRCVFTGTTLYPGKWGKHYVSAHPARCNYWRYWFRLVPIRLKLCTVVGWILML